MNKRRTLGGVPRTARPVWEVCQVAALAALAGLGSACAGPTQTLAPGAAGSPVAPPAVAPRRPPAPAVAPSGPPVSSDEEADRARQDLDALADGDPQGPGRRQTLLLYYVSTAQAALQAGRGEEAFAAFSRALSLVDPAELQDASRPPPVPQLLPLAQLLDRLFSRRGAHAEVVTAMMVEQSLLPGDPELLRRYRELTTWLGGQSDPMQNLVRGRGRSFSSLLAEPPATLESDLEQTYRVWPVPSVRAQLSEMYRAESANHYTGGQKNPREFLQSLSASLRRKGLLNGPAFKLARLYLRVSQPREAVLEIKKLSRLSGEEGKFLDLLEDTLAAPVAKNPDAETEKMLAGVKLALGMAQNPEDADVSLQVCRDVARRAPTLAPAELCVGELAIALDRKGLALRAFERARSLTPEDRQIWEKLGMLYVERLSDLVSEEKTTELEGALAEVEAFYGRMRKQFADSNPGISMALALAEVGRGYYNAGRIDEAQRYLSRSVELHPNAAALELVGLMAFRRGDYALAVATLERARAVHVAAPQFDPLSKAFFAARVGRQIAEAQAQMPDGARAATDSRRQSLRAFEQLVAAARLPPERVAEVEIERGKLHYQGGDRDLAIAALHKAADVLPTDEEGRSAGQQYVELVAFLVQRGELEVALEMYHRALSHSRLSESMKVYCSLWVNDLLVRAGQVVDPLALAFLQSVQSGKWPAELARWAVGQLTDTELAAHADTPGRLAEAHFYLAMARLRAGDLPGAEALWRKVLGSNMMGFFEYEMASSFLKRHGAPTAPLLKAEPGARGRVGSGAAPAKAPPGSI